MMAQMLEGRERGDKGQGNKGTRELGTEFVVNRSLFAVRLIAACGGCWYALLKLIFNPVSR
jgi:hypothetical protein